MTIVRLDTCRIIDWDTFHELFAKTFGFPDFYGRNLNAWIDCMTCLDEPDAGLSSIHVPAGAVVVLQLENIDSFVSRCPEQYAAIVDCSSFVNWRRIENGDHPVLALSFHKSH